MKGNNLIQINHATMIDAVQYYLSNVVFKDAVKVVSVKNAIDYKGFEVVLDEYNNVENPTNRYAMAYTVKSEFLSTATPEQAGRGFLAWCEERINPTLKVADKT
jgi:hypothetical protein